MSTIEQQMNILMAPPEPAIEVLALDRTTVETILIELEEKDPVRPIVTYLRARLSEPKLELWAMFTPGPCETYAFASKEDAEEAAKDLIESGRTIKAQMIERGENVEFFYDWKAEIIPSPWEPDEHFEEMALEQQSECKRLRALAIEYGAENEALRKALGGMLFAFDDGVGRDWSAELLDHARKLCPAAEFKA